MGVTPRFIPFFYVLLLFGLLEVSIYVAKPDGRHSSKDGLIWEKLSVMNRRHWQKSSLNLRNRVSWVITRNLFGQNFLTG